MIKKIERSRRILFLSITLIALGTTLNAAFNEKTGSLGIVLIGIGGLLFLAAMSAKKKEAEENKNQ